MPDQGEKIYFSVILVSVFLLLLVGIIIATAIVYYKRKKQHQIDKASFQQMLLTTQLEIQEQTLYTISQEIHDNIGQVLSLAKLNLGMMDVQQPLALQQKIEDSRNLVGKAIQDLRDLSKSLNTDYVTEMGLLRSIEYEMDMVRKTGVLQASLHAEGTPIKLDPQKELILFRIVQEVINNIIKHAKATVMTIQMNYAPDLLSIQIADNGKGFDLTPLNNGTSANFGLGIRNMHNRAQLIGATFSISSTLESGTSVQLLIPLLTNTNEHAKE